jgi:hypothetical protein
MATVTNLIKFSFKDVTALQQLITPFLFNNNASEKVTEFDVNFIVDGIRYQYGFNTTKNQIYSEWLYSFPNKKTQILFTRDWNTKAHEYNYKFGRNYKGDKTKLISITPPTTLFLSVAGSLGQNTAEPLYKWFNKLAVVGVEGIS